VGRGFCKHGAVTSGNFLTSWATIIFPR
jgi:hypothetical protein